MATVVIPPAYQGATAGATEVEAVGASVLECLEAVDKQYTGFKALVVAPGGVTHHFVKIFVNGEQLNGKEALTAAVAEDDRIEVLSAIAGG